MEKRMFVHHSRMHDLDQSVLIQVLNCCMFFAIALSLLEGCIMVLCEQGETFLEVCVCVYGKMKMKKRSGVCWQLCISEHWRI